MTNPYQPLIDEVSRHMSENMVHLSGHGPSLIATLERDSARLREMFETGNFSDDEGRALLQRILVTVVDLGDINDAFRPDPNLSISIGASGPC